MAYQQCLVASTTVLYRPRLLTGLPAAGNTTIPVKQVVISFFKRSVKGPPFP